MARRMQWGLALLVVLGFVVDPTRPGARRGNDPRRGAADLKAAGWQVAVPGDLAEKLRADEVVLTSPIH